MWGKLQVSSVEVVESESRMRRRPGASAERYGAARLVSRHDPSYFQGCHGNSFPYSLSDEILLMFCSPSEPPRCGKRQSYVATIPFVPRRSGKRLLFRSQC